MRRQIGRKEERKKEENKGVGWAAPTKREEKRRVTEIKEAAKGRILENSAFFLKKESSAKKTNISAVVSSPKFPPCQPAAPTH